MQCVGGLFDAGRLIRLACGHERFRVGHELPDSFLNASALASTRLGSVAFDSASAFAWRSPLTLHTSAHFFSGTYVCCTTYSVLWNSSISGTTGRMIRPCAS